MVRAASVARGVVVRSEVGRAARVCLEGETSRVPVAKLVDVEDLEVEDDVGVGGDADGGVAFFAPG